jgi:hypothetical protein
MMPADAYRTTYAMTVERMRATERGRPVTRDAEHLHALGPSATAEFLAEVNGPARSHCRRLRPGDQRHDRRDPPTTPPRLRSGAVKRNEINYREET